MLSALGPADDSKTAGTAAQIREVAERIIAAGTDAAATRTSCRLRRRLDLTRLAWLLRDCLVEVKPGGGLRSVPGDFPRRPILVRVSAPIGLPASYSRRFSQPSRLSTFSPRLSVPGGSLPSPAHLPPEWGGERQPRMARG